MPDPMTLEETKIALQELRPDDPDTCNSALHWLTALEARIAELEQLSFNRGQEIFLGETGRIGLAAQIAKLREALSNVLENRRRAEQQTREQFLSEQPRGPGCPSCGWVQRHEAGCHFEQKSAESEPEAIDEWTDEKRKRFRMGNGGTVSGEIWNAALDGIQKRNARIASDAAVIAGLREELDRAHHLKVQSGDG